MTTTQFSKSGRERVLSHLRGRILEDPDLPGTFINEQQLATEIGVSRTPVREALLILASEGLVQMLPKRGAYVSPLSGREIGELIELRRLLESYACERAVALGHQPHITMTEILAQQEELTREGGQVRAVEFIELDRQFHQALIDAAGSEVLSATYMGLRQRQLRVGLAALRQRHERWHQVCVEHTRIVSALAQDDLPAAQQMVDDHLTATLGILLTV